MSKEEKEAIFTIDLLENTEIPNLKRELFNAETLVNEMTGSVQKQAIKKVENCRNTLKEYDSRVRFLREKYNL